MKLVVSHPTGNANVRSVLNGFAEADMLAQFHTSIASFSGSMLDRIGSFKPFSEIRRRRFDSSIKSVTHLSPLIEMGRLMASKAKFKSLLFHETGPFCIDSVYRHLDRRVASQLKHKAISGTKGIYAYEDGALTSFKEAKHLGLQCLYDLPTGHWRAARRLLNTELERRPDWASTITGFRDSELKLKRKDDELLLSDLVLVASKFTSDTLNDYPGKIKNIAVVPYGFPPVALNRNYRKISGSSPLKILFVGKLSQQKGIADLLDAVEKIKAHVQLTIVGKKPVDDCKSLNQALVKHLWIPSLNHHQILELMKEQDVLVFPSLFDGFGLVITEAMSQGTPVITTERTGGPDLIDHGVNGWLVNAGSVFSIQSAIEALLSRPQDIAEIGKAAMETANKRPWKKYANDLIGVIESHFDSINKSH